MDDCSSRLSSTALLQRLVAVDLSVRLYSEPDRRQGHSSMCTDIEWTLLARISVAYVTWELTTERAIPARGGRMVGIGGFHAFVWGAVPTASFVVYFVAIMDIMATSVVIDFKSAHDGW